MRNEAYKKAREAKISNIVKLINGQLSPTDARAGRQMIALDWGVDDDGNDDWSIFLIDGKRVDRETFEKEKLWRTENKK